MKMSHLNKAMKKGVIGILVAVGILVVFVGALGATVAIGVAGAKPKPTLQRSMRSTPDSDSVDVVYTWVDSRDAEWRAQRDALTQKRIRAQLTTHAHRWPVLTDSLSELAISLKTVRAFMPWVRTIWVITHRPQKIDDPGVSFVHHDEILDPANLPTFNSMAIETGMHRIKGLAEHFIYFNDDVFIGEPLQKSDFFEDGKPIMRTAPALQIGAQNTRLYKHFGKKGAGQGPGMIRTKKIMGGKIYATNHQAAPMTVSLMKDAEAQYHEDWKATETFPFRDDSNVPVITVAYNHGLRTDQVHTLRDDRLTSLSLDMKQFGKVHKTNPSMFCIDAIQTVEQLEELNDYVDSRIEHYGV